MSSHACNLAKVGIIVKHPCKAQTSASHLPIILETTRLVNN